MRALEKAQKPNGRAGFSELISGMLARIDSQLLVVVLVLLVTPMFQPGLISNLENDLFIKVWRLWRLGAAFVILTLFFFSRKTKDIFSYTALLFIASVLVSTIINKGSVNLWVNRWIPIAAMVMLVVLLVTEKRSRELVLTVYVVCFSMAVINFGSILLFPQGLYGDVPGISFFFGNRNNTYQVLIPAIVCGYLVDLCQGRRIPAAMLGAYGVAIVQIAIIQSMTTLIALVCLGIFLLCIQWNVARRLLNGLTYLALSVVAFVVVVVVRLENVFGFLIVDVLHRNITFTGRTLIWDMVFDFMDKQHALWGYGLSGYKLFENPGYTHAHNEFLNVWFVGGVVGLLLFLMLLGLAACALYRNRAAMEVGVVAAGVGALFVIGVAEQITTPAFFLLLALAFYCPGLWGESGRSGALKKSLANY